MDRELDINKRRGLKSWLIEPYRQVQVGIVLVLLNLFFSVLVLSVFSYYFWDVYSSLSLYFELSKSQESEILSKFSESTFFHINSCFLINYEQK